MMQSINERIHALRVILQTLAVDAFIIPSSDPHLSEYVTPHWKVREWISGFTGSAGTAVVLKDRAGLWTDSRYFLQAAIQLKDTDFTLYKEMLPEEPTITTFLCQNLKAGSSVGVDGKIISINQVRKIKKELNNNNIELKLCCDPFESIWENRPCIPSAPAFIYKSKYSGRNASEKIEAIRTELRLKNTEALLLSSLDEIAWTLNLRGSDVHCIPVVISYLLITQKNITFFIHPEKLNAEVQCYLEEQQVTIHPYSEVENYLRKIDIKSLLINPDKINYTIYSSINPDCRIIEADSPVSLLKAIRNDEEIAGIHLAMQRDGVALVRFLKWLEKTIPNKQETELSINSKLHKLRAEQPLYMGESFDTIAGYKEHGAIVHYSATPESNVNLQPKGFLLLDSGAQYLDGTTDITRTIALGELTEEEKLDYTLVLKGHIALAMARFPAGTRGTQLDALARMPLWQHRMNFLHGTGHGIGHFLSVHEGPQSIRMNENPTILQPGMIISNEPGLYKEEKHGVRTENLMLVRKAGDGMFGSYLEFETITLCPICTKGIIKEMLSKEEIQWFNKYHSKVYEKLSPCLNETEKNWLKEATINI